MAAGNAVVDGSERSAHDDDLLRPRLRICWPSAGSTSATRPSGFGGTKLAQCLPPRSTRDASRICGRRRADSNRRRSQRPRPCDPRSPLTRLRRFLASRTDGSTDCATLRRRERTSAPGVAPVANEMWLQPRRRCRRSGEMWSHLTPTGPAKPVSATGRQRTADAILTSMIAMGTEPWSTNMRRPVRR